MHARLILYKRIANAASQPELDDLQAEMIDRFGLLPESLKCLFAVTAVKLKTQPLGIVRVDLGESGGRIEFSPDTEVDPLAIVNLVQSQPETYRLDGATILRVSRKMADFAARTAFAEELLARLAAHAPGRLVANA